MLGIARSVWGDAGPLRFSSRWFVKDSADRELDGEIRGDSIRIQGAKDTVFVRPKGIWAVADFGMDEQLIPVLRKLKPGRKLQLMSVLRPYHARWDSLQVSVQDLGALRVASVWSGQKEHELIVFDRRAALLWQRRTDVATERRPLEGTERYREYERALPALQELLSAYR